MAIGTRTNIGTTQSTAESTTISLSTIAAVSSGDTIVVASLSRNSSGAAATLSDSAGNTYALAVSDYSAVRTTSFALHFVANALALSSGQTLTIEWTTTVAVNQKAVSAFKVSGITTSTAALDATGTATGQSTTPSVTSGGTVQADELVVGAVAFRDNGTVFTQDSSYATPPVEIYSPTSAGVAQARNIGGGNLVATSTATFTYAPEVGSTLLWIAMIATFTAATSTGAEAALAGHGLLLGRSRNKLAFTGMRERVPEHLSCQSVGHALPLPSGFVISP